MILFVFSAVIVMVTVQSARHMNQTVLTMHHTFAHVIPERSPKDLR